MIIGIDDRSADGEQADHLAHRVREVVGALLGAEVADRVVLATHEVRLDVPHTSVSCALPGAADAHAGSLLDLLADVAGDGGAVVATVAGRTDGATRGDDPVTLAGAWVAVAAAATGTSGRLVHYPGADLLQGRLTVADLLARSVVDEVVVVGGAPHDPATVVDTRDFVRPTVSAGRVRLLVQPAADGVMVPFEKEHPERCCEDH